MTCHWILKFGIYLYFGAWSLKFYVSIEATGNRKETDSFCISMYG
jgi:hypothetical protein